MPLYGFFGGPVASAMLLPGHTPDTEKARPAADCAGSARGGPGRESPFISAMLNRSGGWFGRYQRSSADALHAPLPLSHTVGRQHVVMMAMRDD